MRSIATAGCLLLLAHSIASAQNVSGGEPRWYLLGTQMVRIQLQLHHGLNQRRLG